MSLNRKRRIFRASILSTPARKPSFGVILAVACGLAAAVYAGPRITYATKPPPRVAAVGTLFAPAGTASVIDGDTLLIGDTVVRLAGVSAPARGSLCPAEGSAPIDCGSTAAKALASMIRGRALNCTIRDRDDQGRPVADCTAGNIKLNIPPASAAARPDMQQPGTRLVWRAGS